MITVAEATRIILEHPMQMSVEEIPFQDAVGRILAEDLNADVDFPSFDKVMRDGIAIKFSDFENGIRSFNIQGLQAAGSPPLTLDGSGNCVEIMTGAILSNGADVVIMYEDTEIKDGIATVQIASVHHFENIQAKGLDRKAGSLIVKAGVHISAPELGVAASIGKSTLKVLKLPKIALVSTGDELVPVSEMPLAYQIRRSNVYTIPPLLKPFNIQPDLFHLADDKEVVTNKIGELVANYDVICLSGGVSKGKLDYIPDALEAVGVKQFFYKVRQRPGKPFWFGKAPNGTTVFALPGNPVSTFMCTNRFLVPWLRASMGLEPFNFPKAELTEDFTFKKPLQYFLQVKLSYGADGKLLAAPVVGNGSGDFSNLVDADGFLELPSEQDEFKRGEVFSFISFR
jgi:molybdopterin molybdotransferase